MKRKAKILFSIPNFDTAGSGKALLNIASKLNKDVFEAHICCMHERGFLFQEVLNSAISVHIYPYLHSMIPRLQGFFLSLQKAQFYRRNAFDLVHSFHYGADYSEALSVRLAFRKWVFTKKNMSWGGKSKNAWKIRSALAHQIVVQNSDMLHEFYPDCKKCTLIMRGVDVEKFKMQVPDLSLKASMGIPLQNKVLICVANLVPVKGPELLIGAFRKLHDPENQFHLLIVGDDSSAYAKELKSLAIGDERIIFTGKVSDVEKYLSMADIFVLPTLDKGRKEGSPVSLLEAMSAEKYVIASDTSGIKDILAAFPDQLFPAGSEEALRIKLRDALTMEQEKRRELGRKLRKSVRDNFSIEREVSDHENMYAALLQL
jgi:glycosyltransferase involved in cell wall biosynthesis